MSQLNVPEKSKVVLDKSYLRGVSFEQMEEVAEKSCILITDSLLYETTKDQELLDRHFNKLARLDVVTYVLPYFGKSLGWEAQHATPSPRASTLGTPRTKEDYATLEKNLRQEERKKMLAEKAKQYEEDVSMFIDINRQMANELEESIPPNDSAKDEKLAAFEQRIAHDSSLIQSYANRIRTSANNESESPFNSLNKEWATYRFLQVYSLFNAEKWSKDKRNPVTSIKTLHDVIDMQYLLHAVREGGFATKEKKLARWFSLLRPDGTLFV